MLFNSYIFILLFLPITLSVYFLVAKRTKNTIGNLVLLIASLVFYAYFDIKYSLVIVISSVINYCCAVLIRKKESGTKIKKLLLIAGIAINIGALTVFKYINFIIENINLITSKGLEFLSLVLPLGISFFTFQQIAYLVDTYRGENTECSLIDYSLFVVFFPKVIQGPIVLHNQLLPQFNDRNRKKFNFDNFSNGLYLFALGLSKKVLIADTLGKISDYGFASPNKLSSPEAVFTILAYTFQIYFDFSGYSDMAVGISKMFNFDLPINFNSPYKSRDIGDFWKRWHISLTQFLTRYVYIPLGGNKKGVFRTYINIFIVFLISGIWHGAGYTFIFWGVLHGLASILCRALKKYIDKIPYAVMWFVNFVFINITWVYFRADSLSTAHIIFKHIFAGKSTINPVLSETLLQPAIINIVCQFISLKSALILFFVLLIIACLFFKNTNRLSSDFKPRVATWITTYLLLLLSMLSLSGVSSFLYVNF